MLSALTNGGIMSWNHRVWLEKFGDESFYTIRETYYNTKGDVTACSAEPDEPHGGTLEELQESLRRMTKAVDSAQHEACEGVLRLDGFKFAKHED